MNMLHCLRATVGPMVLLTSSQAWSDTLFSDSFETYATGSNLVGQGGWISNPVGRVVPINNGGYLSSKVIDGRNATPGQATVLGHDVSALNPSLITVLGYDAFATTNALATHNMAVFLTDSVLAPTVVAGWTAASAQGGARWNFTVGANSFDALGGYDVPVKMSLVIDGIAKEVYGIYDFGAGAAQTPHYSVTNSFISSLDGIYIFIDRRQFSGMEIDNLVLATVPEPTVATTLSLGLIAMQLVMGLSASMRGRRRHNDA